MNAIYVWVIGRLVGKPEFPPLIIQLGHFQNTQTSASHFSPNHPFFLLAMTDHLIAAFFDSTATNDFARSLTTLIVDDLRLMLFQITDQFGELVRVLSFNYCPEVV